MPDQDAVSLAEAAQLTGLSTDALRLRWRRGTLSGYKVGRRLYLYREGLPGVDRLGERSSEQFAAERDRSEIELLRQQLAVKDDQIRELHVLLGRLQERVALPALEGGGSAAPRRRWWRRWFGS